VLRFLAGAGIGGAIPNAAAIAAEFTPLHRRAIVVTFTIVCVPLGGMFGGFAAAQILPALGWRALFAVGGIAPLALCVALYFLLPESPGFLSSRRSGHGVSLAAVFGSGNLRDTLSLWLTSFCCLLCVYMSFSWLPTLLTTQGLSLAEASSGLALYNLGGVVGALLCGGFIVRFGSRLPMLTAAFLASASVLFLNFTNTTSHTVLLAGFAAHGLFVNAVQTTSFALAAHLYPTSVRASGVAFALAVGRTGAVLSAFLGAGLITAGRPAFLNFLALAMAGTFVGLALVRNHVPPSRVLRGQM
jgi:MFS transporter, AAHS family, 4-hydroxybenzoate transporter